MDRQLERETVGETVGRMVQGIASLAYILIILALLAGGAYFILNAVVNALQAPPTNVDPAIIGLERLESLFDGDGNAMIGIGLWIGALVLLVAQGLSQIQSKQDAQNKLLEQQLVFSRYLAERAREQTRRS